MADKKNLTDIAKKHNTSLETITAAFDQGLKIEMEHTSDKETASEIVRDHLYEMGPDYYSKLKDLEDSLKD